MSSLFLKIVNMSIAASWLILAVILLRVILKKAPKWINVLLWGIVAIRLICPFSFESTLSLIPSNETIPLDIGMDTTPAIDSGINAINSVVNPIISQSNTPMAGASVNPLQITIGIYEYIWILGMVAMCLYAIISYIHLRKKVGASIQHQNNIWFCDDIQTPFILGCFKPRIYVPSGTDEAQLSHIIAHENAHLKRRDHWWKPLGFVVLAIHWFNPLVWVAYVLLCRDIELACDEKVVRELNQSESIAYSEALLSCSVNRRMVMVCPLAFGEVGVKERVKRVLNYKKPAFWIVFVAVIASIILAVCFLTNPQKSSIYDIYDQDGYNILEQEKLAVTLYVDKSKLPDTIYTAEGHKFDVDEVVVYSTETTRIYLDKVMVSNESDDLLYFIFDFSYDLPKAGSIISPYEYIAENDNTRSNLYLRSEDLKDTNTTYSDAISIRGHGPGTQFAFYVSKDACIAASKTLIMDIVCNKIVYTQEGHGYEHQQNSDSQNSPILSVFQAEVLEIHDGYYLTKPVEGSWELSSADQIEVPIKNAEPSPEPEIGDIIEIEYSGEILETYPARITDVYGIRVVEESTYRPEGILHLGENAKVIEIDEVNNILYVRDIDKEDSVFGDRCAIDCSEAIRNYKLMYVNYDSEDVRDIKFEDFEVGDDIIIGLYDSEKLEAFNGAAIAEQIQLATQRLNQSENKFYLTIGADDVKSIELSMPNSSGGFENADGSLLKKGERIWLENLDGYNDLRGLTITALGENGEIIWTASVPDTEENQGFTHLKNDDWEITNIE